MNMKAFLDDLIQCKKDEIVKLEKRMKESQDIAEVRAIGDSMVAIRNEIVKAERQLESIDSETEQRGMDVMASYNMAQAQRSEDVDPYSTVEYRMAFKNYVQTGKDEFPVIEQRADQFTVTADVGKIIPNTILNEFIKQVGEKHGQIYAKVRKIAIQGGMEIPISDLSASATWIGETAVSETKKA